MARPIGFPPLVPPLVGFPDLLGCLDERKIHVAKNLSLVRSLYGLGSHLA